jgi:hypothetical protein
MSLLLSIFLMFGRCLEPPQSEVPENGTYIYEVAFAEWDGKTMGDEIIVVLKDGHITLKVSENSNAVWMGSNPGDIIEDGTLRKRAAALEAANGSSAMMRRTFISMRSAGCTGGPTIIRLRDPDRRIVLTKKAPLLAGLFFARADFPFIFYAAIC